MPRYTQQGQTIINEATVTEDVELAASGITFTNTELGRVLGRFLFTAGGSTLVNQRGGYIGAPVGVDPFVFVAVTGSNGDDRIIDSGNIQGLVRLGAGNDVLVSNGSGSTYATSNVGAELGDGDDLLRFEGATAPFFAYGNGGEGTDTFAFAATTRQVFGTNLSGFEILSLEAGGNYIDFGGYREIVVSANVAGDFINLIDSDNPLVNLSLGGVNWILQNSDFNAITGSAAGEFLNIGGSTRILQGIRLGGGNDSLLLENGTTAASLATTIDGGASGDDQFSYFLTQAPVTDSLENVTGFERLRLINGFFAGGQTVSLANVSGFTSIFAEAPVSLVLVSGSLGQTTVAGTLGGSITIESGLTIAAYQYGAIGFPTITTLVQANIQNSTTILNRGAVAGGVIFFDGDDHYDGTAGSAAFVHGNAGNDLLEGGAAADDLRGDAGADTLRGNGGNDQLAGGAGRDLLFADDGEDALDGGADADVLTGGLGDDTINGGSNVDTAVVRGNRSAYTVTQTSTGVFRVVGADGTDTLTAVEFLQFDDQVLRLRPGTGVSVNFNTASPAVYQTAMNAIRDFDGNALGGNGSWLRIGQADVNGDGDIDQILVNRAIGRFATVGTAPDGLVYFADHSWAGETRVAGIYIDPLVAAGQVVAGSANDSQRRFQNDLQIENINRVLGANDYDDDGLQEVYFALTDGTAYLRAIMEFDGNIRYANYQSQQEVIDYLTANGFGPETWAGWFSAPSGAEAGLMQESIEAADASGLGRVALRPVAGGGATATLDADAPFLHHTASLDEYLRAEFYG
jgi:hypothetical protein